MSVFLRRFNRCRGAYFRRNYYFCKLNCLKVFGMQIKSLYIDYFRGLREVVAVDLDPHVNLFVGVNGAGKSSILDAISLVMSWFVARVQSAKGRGRDIPVDDISIHSPNGCTVELTFEDDTKWKLYRSLKYKKTDKSDLSDMNRFVGLIRNGIDLGETANLPIIVHYGVNRVIPNSYPRLPRKMNQNSQLDVYRNALNGGQLFDDFFRWFRLSEDFENEVLRDGKDYKDRGLDAVRRAMDCVFPDYGSLRVSRRPVAMYLSKGAEKFKISQLSDGEKCYITLVCDIARRLAIANPVGDPLKGEGIVLIDEIDLHLHPKWQQNVVSKLRETFPNVQFFITTHSPIVASDVDGAVFGVSDGALTRRKTFGKLSSHILSSVFEVSMARNLYVQSLIDSAYDSLSENNVQKFEASYKTIVDILGVDDPEVVGLRIEKIRREKARGL